MKEAIADTKEIQRIRRDYYEQLYVNKMDKTLEMDKLLETYNLSRLSQKEIQNINRPRTRVKLSQQPKNYL